MNNKYQKSTWIWPQIEDAESARKVAHQGMYASLFISGITLFLLGLSTQGFNPFNIDAYVLIDITIFLLVAWRIYAMSRIAAVVGLLFYILSQIYMMTEVGFRMSIIPLFITLTFINSIRGTFAYQKFDEQETEEENLTTEAT